MSCYQFSSFSYDIASQKLTQPDGTDNLLRPKVGLLLETLLQRYPEKCSRTELIDKIWQGNHAVGEKGLNQAIWSLRKHLQDQEQQQIIKTWPNQGYAIAVNVTLAKEATTHLTTSPYKVKVLTFSFLFILSIVIAYGLLRSEVEFDYELTALVYGQDRQFNLSQSQQGWMTWLQESEKGTQLVLAKTFEQKQIRWQAENIVAQAISPDGLSIAFMQQNIHYCRILIMPTQTTDAPREISDCDISDWPSLSWEQSGTTLFFARLANGQSGIARYHTDTQQVEQLFADTPTGSLFGAIKPQFNASLSTLTYIEHDQTSRFALNRWQNGEKSTLYVSDAAFDYCWDNQLNGFIINQLRENGASLQWINLDGVVFKEMALPQRVERLDCSAQIYLTLQRKHFGIKAVDPANGHYRDAIKMFDDSGYFHYQPGSEFPVIVTLKGRTPQISRVGKDFKTRVLMDNQNWINIAYPVLSPDNNKIAFQAFTQSGLARLYIFDIEKQLTSELELPTENFAAPQWTEDGKSILVSLQEGNHWHLYQINIETRQRQMLQQDSLYGMYVHQQLYYASVAEPGLWRKTGDQSEKLLDMPGDAWASWVIDKQQIYSLEYGTDNYELYRTAIGSNDKQLIARLPRNDYVKWSRLSLWQGQLLFTGLLSNDSDIYHLQKTTRKNL